MIELQAGWTVASLADIAEINPRHPKSLADSLLVTFVPMAALSEIRASFKFSEQRSLGEVRKGYTHFAEGDVLFAKITPCMENGKAAVAIGLKNGLGCGTTELHILRPHSGIESKYLYHFVHQDSFRREAARSFTGTAGQLRVSVSFVREAGILLPPLNEQRRIVAKLEKLLQKVDACKERLDKIPTILKRFRQSILFAACSGRLTADWRKEHPVAEPPEDIIESIRQKKLNNTSTPAQKKKIKETYTYRENEDSDLLPDKWEYVALDKLCNSFQYGTSKKSMKLGKIPVLRMGNLKNGEIDWSDLAYTSDDNEIEKYALNLGDVLFNRTNSPELVGKTSIYRGNHPSIFAGYLIRINNFEELDSEYLNYCLNSVYAKAFYLRVKTDGVSQSNINAKKLGKFEVPFCSLEEQHEIVRRVEALFKIADQIEERYKKGRVYVDNLTQSILAKAFRGELIPQDPNDEPAPELLKGIQEK